ncbi:hypothetical protein N9777_07530 [Ascidiaceihabitans sp.]|nr:hypothetical protein [Ascidiaceihabitans sp.]
MKSYQNKSHAVMAQRSEPKESLDNFPTPPWATRALLEKVLNHIDFSQFSCLEPACGAGHMSKVLDKYFKTVSSSDLHNYGYGHQVDFNGEFYSVGSYDWVITNPPFKHAENFVSKALTIARDGVAVLVRAGFLESIGRYSRLFNIQPPSYVAQFSERVPIVKGRLDIRATTATGYVWCVWEKKFTSETRLKWIEPCRKVLESPEDYLEPISSKY